MTERKRLGLWHGIVTVPRALTVLQQVPQVWRLLAVPLVLTAILDALALYFGYGWLHARIVERLPQGGGWTIVRGVASLLAGGAVVFALAWTFSFVFLLLAELVVDSVSEEIEQHLMGHPGSASSLSDKLQGLLTSALQALVLSGVALGGMAFGLIPIAGPIVAIPLTATALGYGFFAVSAGRKAHSLGARFALARTHLQAICGLGLWVFAANLVPLLNVLLLPLFIVAGTLLFLDTTQDPPAAATGGKAPEGAARGAVTGA